MLFPVSQQSLKESYTGMWGHMLISFYQLFCAAVKKALVHKNIIFINRKMEKYSWSKWIWCCDTYGPFKGHDHDLLIAKLGAYIFDTTYLKLIRSHLTNRFQRTKVNTSFSSWSKLFLGVPQGSVLGLILFNIYVNDLFYLIEMTDVCNYDNDTTFHACDLDLKSLDTRLKHDAVLAIEWFESNYMMLNQDNGHFQLSEHKYETPFVNEGETKI